MTYEKFKDEFEAFARRALRKERPSVVAMAMVDVAEDARLFWNRHVEELRGARSLAELIRGEKKS